MDRIKSVINRIWSYEISHIFIYSIIINMAVECLNKRGITGLLSIFTSPVIFLLNTMIIMTTMSIAYFFRKRVFVYALVSVIWLLIAVINFVYKWRSDKSVKAIAPTGAALAFLCFDFFFRIVKGVQPLAR